MVSSAANSPMSLEIGIGLPTFGEGQGLGEVGPAARHVEALGFDSVSVADVALGDGTPALDPMMALAAAATVTERVRLGVLLALPLRPVPWVASQVQALQHLSDNRTVLGVGIGGLPGAPIWRAVGVPERERGRRTDAALQVLPQLIAGEPATIGDQRDVTFAPAAPVPPILVGGNSDAAIRRAATYGDGWIPSQISPDTLAVGIARLSELATERGRPVPAVHVGGLTILSEHDEDALRAARASRASFVHNLRGAHGISTQEAMDMVTAGPAEAADRMAAYAAAGARGIGFSPAGTESSDPADWRRQCDRVAQASALLH